MSDSLYDEFGNYIGSDLDDDENQEPTIEEEEEDNERSYQYSNGKTHDDQLHIEQMNGNGHEDVDMTPISSSSAIILHEDKKYYPDAEEVFGKDVEVMVQDEDTQPLTQPIINPMKNKKFTVTDDEYPMTTFTKQFQMDLMSHPSLIRNVCLVGSIHHGKTSFMDMLYFQTHEKKWTNSKPIKYTDTRKDEQERGISIKATPMSLVLQNSNEKSYLINILDTPGHPNFLDEVSASMRICDGVIVVVDALEGVMIQTEKLLKQAVLDGLSIVVVINKLDRLILELKLPPNDAYLKIKHTLDEINSVLDNIVVNSSKIGQSSSSSTIPIISPELGNVLFSCSEMGWCFSLESFSKIYSESFGGGFNYKEFAKRLWGNLYFHPDIRGFRKIPPPPSENGEPALRSFVQFILIPLYKIISTIIGEDKKRVSSMLQELGIRLPKENLDLDIKPLLRIVMSSFFGKANSFVDLLVNNIPSPLESASSIAERYYTGPMIGPYAEAIKKCDPKGPLLINVTKMLTKSDGSGFDCLGRVLSGTIHSKSEIRILGEKYSPYYDEDQSIEQVTGLYLSEARYKIEIESATPGSWVLIDGIDNAIMKTATITSVKDLSSDSNGGGDDDDQFKAHIFRPLSFINKPISKVAIEPINPTELPKMLEGLRKINKSYPLAVTKAEESGEHIIMGTGELYLDCILHDLRVMYSDIEIKVDDPVITLSETVLETSSLKCYADTQNKKNRLMMIAEPLDNGLAEDIELGRIQMEWPKKQRSEFFREKYDWDSLSADNIWAFGPEMNGPNVLINDILPTEVSRSLLMGISDSIVKGFQWATKEGPLVDEQIRNCKFKLLGAQIAPEPFQRSSGHIVPASRSVTHSSFLTATPRLMEPIYLVEIIGSSDCKVAISHVLDRRRGTIIQESPKPGTPLYVTRALIPVLDSYGFETDLRSHSQGQAFCTSVFDHWKIVPGDPLDKSIKLKPLEPSPQPHLARELLIKTRRRKGLSEDVNFNKYFDDELLFSLLSIK